MCFVLFLLFATLGSVIPNGPTHTTTIHVNPQADVGEMYLPQTNVVLSPDYTQSATPGFHPILINDQPPSYNTVIKSS